MARRRIVSGMTPETALLGRLVITAALIAATTEYAEILRRRAARRAHARELASLEGDGLNGLVRVFLADASATPGQAGAGGEI